MTDTLARNPDGSLATVGQTIRPVNEKIFTEAERNRDWKLLDFHFDSIIAGPLWTDSDDCPPEQRGWDTVWYDGYDPIDFGLTRTDVPYERPEKG